MSKSRLPNTLEELDQLEKDLTMELEEKTNQRNVLRPQIEGLERKNKILQNLVDTFRNKTIQQRQKLGQIEEAEESRMNIERHRTDTRMHERQRDLDLCCDPCKREKADLELVNRRIDFVRSNQESNHIYVHRRYAELQYSHKLVDARLTEVRSRVERMRQFLREKHPEIGDDVLEGQWLTTQKEHLAHECSRLISARDTMIAKARTTLEAMFTPS